MERTAGVDESARATRPRAGVSASDDATTTRPLGSEHTMTRTRTSSNGGAVVATDDVPRPSTPVGPAPSPPTAGGEVVGPIRRRKLDTVLVAVGALVTVVLLVAGGLLTWGSRFADDYVSDELSSQNIVFPDAAALEEEGRTDLLGYAGEQVTTGSEAEAYASYIGGHLEETADGATYADLGAPQRAARAALQEATDNGESPATIDELQAEVDTITAQRDSLFRGETLRGLLLSTYAWSTIGTIAGIAAIAAFVAAAAMVVLVVLGLVHRHHTT
jgi:hypothetical protein